MSRVLFLTSANNGLTQRAHAELQARGHSVHTAVVRDGNEMIKATDRHDFDLIICPFLKSRIPDEICRQWPTIIVHPGPVGDRGPSSLDWAIARSEPIWGVTALSAVAELDAGPIWATRTFDMPTGTKSGIYNGPVADAAIECIVEVVEAARNPRFEPTPSSAVTRRVRSATERPVMTQADRAVGWDAPTADVVRAIRAADGSPGLLTTLGRGEAFVYDAKADRPVGGRTRPGTVVSRRHGAIRVATGDASVWIGHARPRGKGQFKLPATHVLSRSEFEIDVTALPIDRTHSPSIRYERKGETGILAFDFYNGAMSTAQCHRLLRALRAALAEPTKVVVLTGGSTYFSNGIHLNLIEAAREPAVEAWRNINAINAIAREIVLCQHQVIIAAFSGNAGAGGVMLPLGADVVAARAGIMLNPHYATMGLFGSELHTLTLPQRVGSTEAHRLTADCLPIDVPTALDLGLADTAGPHDTAAFDDWLIDLAFSYTDKARHDRTLTAKRSRFEKATAKRSLDAIEAAELDEMAQDMFGDRSDFAAKRHAFVHKIPAGAMVPTS